MCGIAGFWLRNSLTNLHDIIKTMTDKLTHRGPDDVGCWVESETGLALGHRRLSILDLSPTGHQPMISQSERYVITYNGEIYNYRSILLQIEKASKEKGFRLNLRGTSDTEVILTAIEIWGLQYAVKQFIGMFAFALYDREERSLHLVRDRIGEKPLYYGFINSDFVFASELKAIKSYRGFRGEIDRNVLALYFRYNYIPAPYSIYKGIYKLLPGTILTIRNENYCLPEPKPYWSAYDIINREIDNSFRGNEDEAIEHLEILLKDSIKNQMISDVPLGAFLSGGIDSSLVVSLMQIQSSIPVKTFTIGFNEERYNEAKNAKEVAMHLGTDHTELYVSPEEAMNVAYHLPDLYDEPFADSSQIPTYLVSKLAKSRVTVSLSGDAGDELFGGYNRYFLTERIWRKIGLLPNGIRNNLSKIAKSVSPETWDRVMSIMSPALPKKYNFRLFGDKIHKLADILSSRTPYDMYFGLVSHWKNPTMLVLGSNELQNILSQNDKDFSSFNIKELMMYLDLVTYLPDDILVKVDRATMGVSLESRVPFLDHRVVEYAWSLPLAMKIKNNQGKWPLRQILYKYVPKKIIERPKMGFGVPIDDWIKGPMREWAEDLLAEKNIKDEGYLNSDLIHQKWHEHLSGNFNWQYNLWGVLMFEAWLKKQK